MRGSRRIGLLAISVVCVFAFTAVSASAGQFWTNAAKTQALPDAAGNNGGTVGYGYPIELVNSGELELKSTGLTNKCQEGEVDTYVNKNTTTLAEALVVAGQFECDNPTSLATPSAATAVFTGVSTVTVKNLKFVILPLGTALKCVFETNAAGIAGVWANVGAVGVEEELGSNVTFTKVKLFSTSTGCPTEGELTGKFAAETYLQAQGVGSVFNTEQVFYG
jgi:hypothetical protein